jgi:4-hydroxythreonine-4-phosphate dehydrogenase
VCGLNPHAGENGYIGTEEKNIIIPAINSLKNKGFNVEGPFSADTIFTRSEKTDLILAMFHDQALPVIKTIGFGDIVNTTLGLPIIRTSVDHGTALDIAGTNIANPKSLVTAVRTSIDIVNQKNAR